MLVILMAGDRRVKSALRPDPIVVSSMPMTHALFTRLGQSLWTSVSPLRALT